MIKNLIRTLKKSRKFFFLSLILIFLIHMNFEIPLNLDWKLFTYFGIVFFIFRKEKSNLIIIWFCNFFITLLPTIFTLFTFDFLSSEIIYTIVKNYLVILDLLLHFL